MLHHFKGRCVENENYSSRANGSTFFCLFFFANGLHKRRNSTAGTNIVACYIPSPLAAPFCFLLFGFLPGSQSHVPSLSSLVSFLRWIPNFSRNKKQTKKIKSCRLERILNVGRKVGTLRKNWFLLTYLENQTRFFAIYGIHKYKKPRWLALFQYCRLVDGSRIENEAVLLSCCSFVCHSLCFIWNQLSATSSVSFTFSLNFRLLIRFSIAGFSIA